MEMRGRGKALVESVDVLLADNPCPAFFHPGKQGPEPFPKFARLPSQIVQTLFRESLKGFLMLAWLKLADALKPQKKRLTVSDPFQPLPVRSRDGIQKIERHMVAQPGGWHCRRRLNRCVIHIQKCNGRKMR